MKGFIKSYPLLFIILLSILLRVLSFGYSVIDHDESTYLVIANELLKGSVLYVDVWDTKPPGIFLIFASFIAVFGKSIWAIRLLTAVVVGISAYLLFRVKFHLDKDLKSSYIAAVIFLVFCSAYRFGMAANTELYFGLMTILGLYFYLIKQWKFTAAFVWGMGYIIKYVIVFDLISFWLVLTITLLVNNSSINWRRVILNNLILLIGFLLPFGLVVFYYWFNGLEETFFEASFVIPSRYQNDIYFEDVFNCLLDFHLKYLPFMVLFYYSAYKNTKKISRNQLGNLLPIVWFLFAFVSVIIPGKYFTHYYLQLAMPVAWVVANAFLIEGNRIATFKHNFKFAMLGISLAVVLIAGNQIYFFTHPDKARIIVKEIEAELIDGKTIYAGERYQVLYFLLDLKPPTKYVHPTLIINPNHIKTLNVNPDDEFKLIFEKQPQFLVYHNFVRNSILNNQLMTNYTEISIHKDWHINYYKLVE